ncbi:MAG TPA: ACT domain-containing protein, partial [Microthrixaceae bacterium]|nr:ACT domain-containing protein [Microthrixaceae bacterium]
MAPRQTASALSVGNAARPDAALLLRVSGPDHPGITADLMALLGVAEVDVQDVEQVLVRGHLTLAVAVADPGDGGTALAAVLEQLTRRHDVTVSVVPAPAPPLISDPVEAVTVLGHELETPLSPAEIGAIAAGINASGGNIDRIVRLA